MRNLIFALLVGILTFLGCLIIATPFTILLMEFEYPIIKWVLITIMWLSSILVSLLAGVDTYIDEKNKIN